ncbi:MAG: carboxy terminal-processing peptidase [Verrucomicrobiota bacterium]|jgi:carboxyl-terminal processing protease
MIERLTLRILPLLLSLWAALPLWAAEAVVRSAAGDQPAAATASALATNGFHLITPGPIDGQIASATAYMLENYHYLKKPFDDSVSSQFLDRYLETLDPQRIHFTQADFAEFEPYRTNLNRLTNTQRRPADTKPACAIFNRFLERLEQRTAYAQDLLKNERFTFDTDERVTINRKGLPYPADLGEAKKLWRERLRFEYLQELLGKSGARKKSVAAATKKKPLSAETNALVKVPEPPKAPTADATAGAGVPPTLPAAPAIKESRRPLVLPSPKEAERASAMQAAAGKARAAAEAARVAAEAEAKSAAQARAQAARAEQEKQRAAAEARTVAPTNQLAGAPSKKTDDEEIIETLSHRYHRNLRFFTDWNNDDVLQTYLTALARVYDPHSDYFGHAQLEQFSITMNLSLFGIGAELVSEDGYCKIRRLLPGGPAIKSKLIKEGDQIVAVAQSNQPPVDVVDMNLTKAVQLIRGPKGTEVRLTIIPAGALTTNVLSLIRDEISIEDSAAKARIIELPDLRGGNLRLGVIDLPSFYATFDALNTKDKPEPKSTTADVTRLLAKLKEENVAGLILDLRRNGGGSLEEAIKLTGLFIKTGPVVQVRDENGKVQEADDTDPSVLYDGPLVVLTSRFSASASEIVAGALQDYGRALIVGDASTHGKGTVQSVNQLRPLIRAADKSLTNDPGALKLTIKEFFRPSGLSTQLKGVLPDIVLPSVANESKDIGESALENPLPCETIPSANYDHFNLVEPYLPELRKHSAERVAADKEFAYVREDIEQFKKHQADKTISLNEKQRLKEQDEAEARQKARDKERLARQEPPETVYELTLKQAGLSGLPPPVAKTNAALARLSVGPGAGPSAASTNSAATTAGAAPGEDSLDEAEAQKPAAPDEPLVEAEHILVDYLSVLPKGNLVTAGH